MRGRVLVAVIACGLLTGCTSALRIQPALPPPSVMSGSLVRVGVYLPPASEDKIEAGSGIWPGTTYSFSPDDVMQEGLATLTRRHFQKAGVAENAGDKRWDYVLEYHCEKPSVADGDLHSRAPLRFVLRNPLTGRETQSVTLVGEGSAQSGRFFRVLFGRLAEKRALEHSLNEAYTNLYRSVEGQLVRTAKADSNPSPDKPYRRRERSR